MNNETDNSAQLPTRQSNSSRNRQSVFKNWWRAATTGEKIRIIIAALYIVSPVDLIPEALLGPFGIADDIGAMIVIAQAVFAISQRYQQGK